MTALLALLLSAHPAPAQVRNVFSELDVGRQFSLKVVAVLGGKVNCSLDPAKIQWKLATSIKGIHPTVAFARTASMSVSPYSVSWNVPFAFNRDGALPSWYELRVDPAPALALNPPGSLGPYPAAKRRFFVGIPGDAGHLQRMREKWVGKTVWVYGGRGYTGPFDAHLWPANTPVRITAIVPGSSGWTGVPVGAGWPNVEGGPREIESFGSYEVHVLLPPHPRLRMEGYGPEGLSYEQQGGTGKLEAFIPISDAWQIPQMMTTVAPLAALKGQPGRIRKAFLSGKLCPGMPRNLVLRLIGLPDLERPFREVMSSPVWDYPDIPPYSFDVSFDARGKMTDAGSVGQSP